MFDYDSRPATPIVRILGTRASADGYRIRDFLARNGRPFEWVDVDDPAARDRAPGEGPAVADLPLCVLPDGRELRCATVEQVAAGLGMVAAPKLSEYDLAVIGAGPAGLGAALYAASEGLSTVVVEGLAPGGQAGTTSLIENYLGFPQGISGNELATRATAQARRFGAEILLARRLVGFTADGPGYVGELSDGSTVRGRALVVATGVEWRRLELQGIDDLLGAGVYYGAGPSEAVACRGCRVAIIGGGNSAGQAAVRFSRYASRVTLLVRGVDIRASMSQYLVDRVTTTANIEVRTGSEVVGFEADGRLRQILVASREGAGTAPMPVEALFICIGGVPRTGAATGLGALTDTSGYLVTGGDLVTGAEPPAGWPLDRPPLFLETSLPGLFAAGDVRGGSIKRCAAAIGEGAMAVALVHRRLAEVGGG